jgi:hypothetical protein
MKKIYIILGLVIVTLNNLNAQVNLNLGLIAKHNFTDESLLDSGPNAIDLINNNGASPTDDRFGNPNSAYSFDGVDDYLSASNDPVLTLGFGATISLWVKLNDVSVNQKLIGKLTTPPLSTDGGYLIGVENGQVMVETWVLGSVYYSLTAGSITANQWTHIAVTFQSTNYVTLHIDGQAIDSVQVSDALEANTNDLIIGAAPWDPSLFKSNGVIDDIRLYNRKVNNAELNAIYSEVVTGNNELAMNEITITNHAGIVQFNAAHQQKISRITVSDVSGRLVLNEPINSTFQQQIDLTTFPKGIYLATVQTNSGEKTFKILN